MKADWIIRATVSVTSKWEKQRKAEIRGRSRETRRRAMVPTYRTTIKDVAWDVMEEAYRKASDDGRYPALARQIMYAARPEILRRTGETQLDSQYFTQTLLPDYMEEHGCSDWNVAYDARGNFFEPYTGMKIPLGTIDVDQYLDRVGHVPQVDDFQFDFRAFERFPTCGPRNRYGAILFIEKEGFFPLLQAAAIAERYDVGLMSTKGLSVTAARKLVDVICGKYGVPLLVMHDFDKAGFSIIGTLTRDTRRYSFGHERKVIDLGLRLADAEAWGLQSEEVDYGKTSPRKVRTNLRKNRATAEEVDFLCSPDRARGRRVELNAFTSRQLIEWLELKLEENGIEKVLPDEGTIETAYRRALEIAVVQNRMKTFQREARDLAAKAALPENLRKQVADALDDDPYEPWDAAVMDVTRKDSLVRGTEERGVADSAS